MVRKKITPKQQKRPVSPRMKLLRQGVEALDDLIYRMRWDEAGELLEALTAQHPNEAVLLYRRASVCAGLGDSSGEADALEQLHLRSPQDPQILLALIGARTRAEHPALALRAAQAFLALAPSHEEAPRIRGLAALLEEGVGETASRLGLGQGPEAQAALQTHEEVLIALQAGEFAQGAALATELLGRFPDLISVRNNLTILYAMEGRLDEALAEADQVLSQQPGNLHALGNKARVLCLSGRTEEARALAARLLQTAATSLEEARKQAETLSLLGDDEGVIRLYESPGPAGAADDPILCHFAAVAYARKGREQRARHLWQRARPSPWITTVNENVQDLSQPPGAQSGAWAFSLRQWISRSVLEDLVAAIERAGEGGGPGAEQAQRQAARDFLARRPALRGLLPILLDRGDPLGRELALRLCEMAGTAECLEALRVFAFGQQGPEELRMKAAMALVDAGAVPAEPVRLWIGGQWQEIMPLRVQIYSEPTRDLPEKIARQHERAMMLLRQGAAVQAERLMRQALDQAPGAPSLIHNLANCLMVQDRVAEAVALTEENHRQHPDYLFARTSLAAHSLARGDIARAEELLRPLRLRRRMHVSEVVAYASAQADLALAKDGPDAARPWINMLAEVSPEHPNIEVLERKVALASLGAAPSGAPSGARDLAMAGAKRS